MDPKTNAGMVGKLSPKISYKKSLLFGTPASGDMVHGIYLDSMLQTGGELDKHGISRCLARVSGGWTAKARNHIAAMFMAGSYSHLMWIDADIGWNPPDIYRLMQADVDVIGALYPRKHMVWEKGINISDPERLKAEVARRSWPCQSIGEPVGDRVRVDWLQTGFMMVKREAFEKLRKFLGEDRAFEDEHGKPCYEYFKYANHNGHIYGEDYWFCRELAEAGIDVWRLENVGLGHVGQYVY